MKLIANRTFPAYKVAVFLLLFSSLICAQNLVDYKRSPIQLRPDADFSTGTDWESLFYDVYKDLAVCPDGSVFVSNSRQHHIYKFSSSGKLEATIGQKGQGPADLYYPGDLSILDNKFLVVGEYASTRRISIFDLEGKFVKVLKTERNQLGCTAIGNNHIAYRTYSNQKEDINTITVFSKAIDTGKEVRITSLDISSGNSFLVDKGYMIGFPTQTGTVFIAGTGNGNILVGNSSQRKIAIYSVDGKQVSSFTLKIEPLVPTAHYKSRFKEKMVDDLKVGKKIPPHYITKIKNASFEKCFDKYLPFYRYLLVDSSGNILVFKWFDCLDGCQKVFQVYSPEGRFICETALDEGPFQFDLDYRWQNLAFTDKGIFGLFQLKDSEDISLRLVRVPLSGMK